MIQVMSRMRGGGRHTDKRSKAEKEQATNPKRPEQRSDEGPATVGMDEVLRRPEEKKRRVSEDHRMRVRRK